MRKFKIPRVPATTNKSIKFPNWLVEDIEEQIADTDCTFSAFVIEAARVAVENLKDEARGKNSENWNVGDGRYKSLPSPVNFQIKLFKLNQ